MKTTGEPKPLAAATGTTSSKPYWQSSQNEVMGGGFKRDKKFEGFSSFGKGADPSQHRKLQSKDKRGAANIEDQYINNLQQQVYFLELQMKLLKDRQVQSKQKAAGFEHLMKDGIPLNEHFIALKNKYNTDQGSFENAVKQLSQEIRSVEKDNENCKQRIAILNQEYGNVDDNYNKYKELSNNDIKNCAISLEMKLFNESNTCDLYSNQKQALEKKLNDLKSLNIHLKRTIEKNKMFVKSKIDPVRVEKCRAIKKQLEENFEKIKERDLAYDKIKKDAIGNQMQKRIQDQNVDLVQNLNRLERDLSISRSKLNELESLRQMNIRYLLDEANQNAKLVKQNQQMQDELDYKQKLNQEDMRKIVAQTEFTNTRTLQNEIKYDQQRTTSLLNMLRDEQESGKSLLDQKMNRNQELVMTNEDIKNYTDDQNEQIAKIIALRDQIDGLEKLLGGQIEEDKIQTASITELTSSTQNLEEENAALKKKLHDYLQQIDINNLLRDVDTDEVRILAQNNSLVNQAINKIMSKWDTISGGQGAGDQAQNQSA